MVGAFPNFNKRKKNNPKENKKIKTKNKNLQGNKNLLLNFLHHVLIFQKFPLSHSFPKLYSLINIFCKIIIIKIYNQKLN